MSASLRSCHIIEAHFRNHYFQLPTRLRLAISVPGTLFYFARYDFAAYFGFRAGISKGANVGAERHFAAVIRRRGFSMAEIRMPAINLPIATK